MAILHFTLATHDVVKTAAFFRDVFGWKMAATPDNVPMATSWLEIAPGQQIHLVFVPGFEPSLFESEFGRHIALSYPKKQFEELKARLTRHGAEIIPPGRETPFERFFFRDPNGYIFEIIEEEYTAK